ncbi:hypothetical protein QN277_010845 [Acacia crassicarpa]|uniref:Protein kinase domain-containing protein n=1 Tax=Acacia crassicarpa TaxID=499986 RepID=A0AAE1IPM1_9FABA|nr:hypothetical protein QN277_010845 [Acacia crassicarpa]
MGGYGYISSFFFVSLCFWFCPMVLCKLSQNQNNTMISLSRLLNGTDLTDSWNIATNPNPCHWKGVACDQTNSSVIKFLLYRHSISSSEFLTLLCQIESLQHLDLSGNSISSIPDDFITDCGKVAGLKLLNFSSNNIWGPLPTFRGFDGLESLDMSFNHFSGKVDSELAELASLKSLNLSFNSFNGPLPTKLGNSANLEQLELSNNHFVGKIPAEIQSYTNLTVLDLRTNNISGSIPGNIGDLSRLETLILSSNQLGGEVPSALSNIKTLVRFAANQNEFNGSVPSGITRFLKNLDLSYNMLSGPIPAGLLSQLNLVSVDLSNNSLSGPLPADISSSIVRLRLGGNSLNGTISPKPFATGQNLMYVELEANNLTGQIPSEVGSCQNLALLNLAQNQLSGELPAELGKLKNLQVLQLQGNKLSGQIPTQVSQLKKLLTLNLSDNSLNGTIPQAMFNLVTLSKLYLQQNKLSGSIPTSIIGMESLIELQLGENQLSGSIPKMPVSLQIALNLSRNLFAGPIPSILDGLNNLEILDLSNNKFDGKIPDFLTSMPALTQLQLSNNSLSGVIPDFNSHVKVDLGGNNGLVNKTGTPNTSPRSPKGSPVVMAVLVAIAAAVFLVGLVTVLAVLISRRLYKVNDEHLQPYEDPQPPQVIQGNLLTPNGIHRSNIDFSKAMKDVAETSNVTLKTRFSTYYKTIMPSGSIYFVKKLNWSEKLFPLGSHDKFGKELEVLAKLNNSNVMTPLAYVLSTDSAYILYEFISNGSLYDALHGSLRNSLDWASRYSIAVGAAQGLSFLHGFTSGPILLLDLSSKSIMLKSLKEPLVGDIELYKVTDPSKSTGSFSAVAGSVGYIPPEYAYTMRVTMAGNVYSFGVILLELLTGKPAVTDGTELVKWVMRNSVKQEHILDFSVSKTSQAVKTQMLAILQVALACVSSSPEARPKMKSVLRMLLNAR